MVLDSQVLSPGPYNSHHHHSFVSTNTTAKAMLPHTHRPAFGLFLNRMRSFRNDRERYCKVPFTGTLSGNK